MLWDASVFRSGFYMRWVEPASLAGATRAALMEVGTTYVSGRRNVLLLGNSQIGEAFSTRLAAQNASEGSLHFVNGSIAGSDPRVWYHLLREFDPDADRFSAVVLAVRYDVGEFVDTLADRAIDIGYLAPLIRLQDIALFPDSFDSPILRSQARRAIVFPTQSLQRDLFAMLASPMQRYKNVRVFDATSSESRALYPGRPNALPDLSVDPQRFEPVSWNGVDEKEKKGLENYFRTLQSAPPVSIVESNERYYRLWLSRIAAPYRAHGIPVVLIQVPRGPWYATLKPLDQPRGVVHDLIQSGIVQALPADTFTDLEYPKYFFDGEHMNRAGRERFTPRLVERLSALLH